MTQSLISVGVFMLVLACIPFALKWWKVRAGLDSHSDGSNAKIISALAVGPHQRVVTIEVGPVGGRQRLTLGVTGQSITCLHTTAVIAESQSMSFSQVQNAISSQKSFVMPVGDNS